MGRTAQYCPTRRDLETQNYNLVSRLSRLSAGLIGSAGVDTKAFNATTAECKETHAEITQIRQQLQAHRAKHGC